jgi:hypothetical protein
MESLAYRKMYFEEFCAAAISTYQLEALEGWEQIASNAFEHFEQEGNRVISVEELARVCIRLPPFDLCSTLLFEYHFKSLLSAGIERGPFSLHIHQRLDQKLGWQA